MHPVTILRQTWQPDEISEGTVKTHVKNLLEKLDATSRTTEALAVAGRRGLITL